MMKAYFHHRDGSVTTAKVKDLYPRFCETFIDEKGYFSKTYRLDQVAIRDFRKTKFKTLWLSYVEEDGHGKY
jgi:hypothetical protein